MKIAYLDFLDNTFNLSCNAWQCQ